MDLIEKIILNDSEQWISIRAQSLELPLILFLHGGPGTAQIPFARRLQSGLDETFTVVNWDQRGSGRSFRSTMRDSKLSLAQILADTETLIDYLLMRFGQTKLILVGHSWGTILGFEMCRRVSEKISVYIGLSQIINMVEGEIRSYYFTIDEAKKRKNSKALSQLRKIGPPPYRKVSDGGIQRSWLGKFGGITFDNSGIWGIFRYFSFKDCGLLNLLRFFGGIVYSLSQLEDEQMRIDYTDVGWNSSVPCFLICGRHDFNVPFELVETYARRNQEKNVKLVWFEKSAHLPNYEEREKFISFCNEILVNMKGSST